MEKKLVSNKNSPGQCVRAVIAIIAVEIAIVALVLIIAIAIAYSGTLNNQQADINQLTSEINMTNRQVSSHAMDISGQSRALEELNTRITELQAENTRLTSETNRQVSSHAMNISGQSIALEELNTRITELQAENTRLASEFNSSIIELQTEVGNMSRPMNFYSNCTQDRAGCSIGGPGLENAHHFQCSNPLPGLPANKEGFYTADVRCECSSNADYFASAHLQYSGNNVFCFCDLILPDRSTGALQLIPTNTTFTCDLVIDRCPLT